MFDVDVAGLDLAGLGGLFHGCVRDEVIAQNRQLFVAAAWADRHPGVGLPKAGPDPVALVGERAVRPGGAGTPEFAEFAPADLGPEGDLSVGQAMALITDALDLRHRFPLLWRDLGAGRARAWPARKVANATRELTVEQAARVDRMLVGKLFKVGRRRLENLIEAALYRVDAEHMQELAEKARRSRFVRRGQSNEDGIASVHLRMDAPDAISFEAGVDRMARVLQAAGRIPGVPDRQAETMDEWRAVAAGLMGGNPVLAAKILIEHERPDLLDVLAELHPDNGRPQAPPPDNLDREVLDEDDVSADDDQTSRPTGTTGPTVPDHQILTPAFDAADREQARQQAVRQLLRALDPSRLATPVLFHVHCMADDLAEAIGTEAGDADAVDASDRDGAVARIEEIGPALLSQLRDWFGAGSQIRLQPVIDTGSVPAVDAYEVPDRMRAALFLRNPTSVFPHATSTSRGMDIDHSTPYRWGKPPPPGQTGLHNLGPLGRGEHRARTFGRNRLRQPWPGHLHLAHRHRAGDHHHRDRHPRPRHQPVCRRDLARR